MVRGIDAPPVLLAQAFQIKNGKRCRAFQSLGEQMCNFLRNGPMLSLGTRLELPIKRVGKVLDIQDGQSEFLPYSSIMEE